MHKPLPFACDSFVNLNEWTEGDDVWSPPITNIDLAGNVEKRLERLIGRQRAAAGSHGSALPPPAPTQLLPLCFCTFFSRLPQVLPWFNKGNFLSSPRKSRRRAAGRNMQEDKQARPILERRLGFKVVFWFCWFPDQMISSLTHFLLISAVHGPMSMVHTQVTWKIKFKRQICLSSLFFPTCLSCLCRVSWFSCLSWWSWWSWWP